MGGGKGSFQQQSTFQPPPWALAGGQQSVETAQQLAQTPFDIPTQPIASLQPQQTEAMQEVENAQGMAQPYFNAGTGLEEAGSQANIGQYFGAESAGVVPQLQNIFGQQMAETGENAQQTAGGVGADRVGVAEAELANQQGLSAGQTLSQLFGQSVSQAQAGAGLEQSAGANIAGMGTAAQGAALQGATAELQSGTLAQQQLQNQENAQYENTLQGISWPFQTNQYLGSMSAGVTPAMGGTGITSGNTKSSMASTSGLGKGLGAIGTLGAAEGGAINADTYADGGGVDPLMIGMGKAPPIPMDTGGGFSVPSWYVSPPATSTASASGAGSMPPTQPGPFSAGSGAPSFNNPMLGAASKGSSGGSGGGLGGMMGGKGMSEGGAADRRPMDDGGALTPWGPITGAGGFAPASGDVVSIPFADAEGGPQPLLLTDSGVPPPPNIHAPTLNLPTAPSGTEGLNIRGPGGASTFTNPFLTPAGGGAGAAGAGAMAAGATGSGGGTSGQGGNSDNPFSGFLGSLYAERNSLMGALGGGSPTGSPGGQGGWASSIPAMAGGWGAAMAAGKRHGGRVSRLHRALGGDTPTPQQEVGNLLGAQGSDPAGGNTVLPSMAGSQTPGHPSPQQQWAMTYHGPNPMASSQQGGGGGGGQSAANPFTSVDGFDYSKGNFGSGVSPAQNAAAARAGIASGLTMDPKTGTVGPGPSGAAPTPPLSPAGGGGQGGSVPAAAPAPPTGEVDLGSDPDAGIFAADGGPIHMDDGGDPFSTPQADVNNQIGFNLASMTYGGGQQDPTQAPFQTAGLTMTGGNNAPPPPQESPPATPFATGNAQPTPLDTSGPIGQSSAPGTRAPDFMPYDPATTDTGAYYGRSGITPAFPRGQTPAPSASAPTPPISMPPTQPQSDEQKLINTTVQAAQKPVTPPQPPGQPPAPPPGLAAASRPQTPAAPQLSMPAQRVMGMQADKALSNAFGPMWSMGAPDGMADAIKGKTVGQLLTDPQYKDAVAPLMQKPQMQNWLKQVGVTDQDIQNVTKPPAQPPAAGAAAPSGQRDTSWVPQGKPIGSVVVPMEAAKYAIGKFESGNDYNNVGVPTKLGRALGRYQVMTDELPQQLKNSGLPPMTPQEFLKNHAAQDQLFEHEFGARMQKYGNFNDAATDWFAGSGSVGKNSNARDALGTSIPQYVANTQANLKEWAGGAGDVPRETAQGSPTGTGTGYQRNPPNYDAPPGMPPINKTSQFLMALSGDPSAYLKYQMNKLGYYQESAKWDAARNQQYGSMAPPESGAAFLNELDATRGVIGKVAGAEEQQGQPGSVTAAGASGHAGTAHPGAEITPTGGAGAAPGAAPPPAGGTAGRPPQSGMDEAIQRAVMGAASGNPQVAAQANQFLTGVAQRGLIDAETLQKKIAAAKESIGFMPGYGPYQINPNAPIGSPEQFRSLTPPGAGGAGAAGAGAGPQDQRNFTPGAPPAAGGPPAATAPTPGGGPPAPLPSGAGPETVRPTSARDFLSSDPAFQPLQNAPRTPQEMASNQYASSLAQDTRAWGDPQGVKKESDEAIKDSRERIQADRQADLMLTELEESLKRLPKSGLLAPGPTMAARNHIIGIYNDVARITAPLMGDTALKQVDPNAIGSVEQVNKLANTLAFALARTLGSREAVQIVQQARNSVPSADVSPRGAKIILEGLRAGISADRDYYNGLQNWASSNMIWGNSIKGYDEWFPATHPSDMYTMRANAAAAEDPSGTPLSPGALQALRAHPDRADAFDRQYGTPGLGRYYLNQWSGR